MGTERTEADRKRARWVLRVSLALGVAVVVGVFLFAAVKYRCFATLDHEPDRMAAVFTAVEALFGGLAFLGVIAAVLLQREELQLQRDELRETRAQLERTADEQKRAADHLNRQVEVMARTARIGALQALVSEIAGRQAATAGNTSRAAEMRIALMREAEPITRALRRELKDAGLDHDALLPGQPPVTTP